MIYCNLDNFHVSKEDLRNSPSRFDGISEETEMELRNFGTTLIQEGGTLLDLPQVVMATAQVLFHRFFCKKSMAKYDVEVRHCPMLSDSLQDYCDIFLVAALRALSLVHRLWLRRAYGSPASWRRRTGTHGMCLQSFTDCREGG